MEVTGLNRDDKITLKEAFPDSNPFNLDKEQLEQMMTNVNKYFHQENETELTKSLMDQITLGESIIKIGEDGKFRAIDPMSPEGCEIHLKHSLNNQEMDDEIDRVLKECLAERKKERCFIMDTGREGYINYEIALMKSAGMDEKSINIKVERLRSELPEGMYRLGDW
jgi:hypothetical protein